VIVDLLEVSMTRVDVVEFIEICEAIDTEPGKILMVLLRTRHAGS
jgi:hypothetical protein